MQDQRAYRLTSIDMLRGLAIVVMAIDHVRDFFLAGTTGDPLQDPDVTPAVFVTRWITHFCAPVFTVLAGTSAGLMTARKSPGELNRFLLTRGLWLVLVEVTLITTACTFQPLGSPRFGGRTIVILQTIWAIGVSMIALSFLQRLGRRTCLLLGIVIVAGHNLLDHVWPATSILEVAPIWVALHGQMSVVLGPFLVVNVYPILPWIGVMLVGFGASAVFEQPAARRNALLRRIGVAMTAAFVALRALDVYGDPNRWQWQPGGAVATVMDFLDTTKYPPSLLFSLMTLGPAAVLCGCADHITRGPLAHVRDVLAMFGRVPFAFYVTHFYVLHVMAIGLGMLQGFAARDMCVHFNWFPAGYGVPLWAVYALWGLVVAMLYPLCRWVAGVKRRRRDWWLSYL